jgi:hypothetical protein
MLIQQPPISSKKTSKPNTDSNYEKKIEKHHAAFNNQTQNKKNSFNM